MDKLTNDLYDCIVVGSGPAGVMCAQTLVESGRNVLLIDAGIGIQNTIVPGNFYDLRREFDSQQEIFLGKELGALSVDPTKAFSQATPQRKYVIENTHELTPLISEQFRPLESLATGGLGEAWGLGCFTFSDSELLRVKLNLAQMRSAYQVVADRIGLSYSPDDIQQYIATSLLSLQPSIEVDSNAKEILRQYDRRREKINKDGFYAGVPMLSLLTQDKGDRKATDYSNMDFYYNHGNAAYRPSVTIDTLKQNTSFQHMQGVLVTSFDESQNNVVVNASYTGSGSTMQLRGRKLVLACNILGTARIVLRSLHRFDTRLPLLCNPYSLLVSLQWSQLGKLPSERKTSTAQVCIFHDSRDRNLSMASLYTYSSLMLFRILRESRLNFADSLKMMKYLQGALVIAGIHHASETSDSKFVFLEKNDIARTGDVLKAEYVLSDDEQSEIKQTEKRFAGVLRQLGCVPFKKVRPLAGASAHYAGTLPFSESGSVLTLSPDGLLAETRNVYVADASGFNYLPAKGPTLTIMANAHNTALNIIKND